MTEERKSTFADRPEPVLDQDPVPPADEPETSPEGDDEGELPDDPKNDDVGEEAGEAPEE